MADGEEVKTSGFNRKKIKQAIKAWFDGQANYDEVCGEAKAEFSTVKDGLLESLELNGVNRTVFKTVIQRITLLNKAEGLRGRLSEEKGLQDQYDSILVEAGLIAKDDTGEEKTDEAEATPPAEGAPEGATAH